MNPLTAAALFGVAVIGGIINSVSGGGTFLVFPSLLLAGVPAVSANATNTVALWPGVISSAVALRSELRKTPYLAPLALASFAGGACGAVLLLKLPAAYFETAVPFLLLGATLLFACNPVLAKRLRTARSAESGGRRRVVLTVAFQFAIALYGGYFGGGIGILMLATLGFMGLTDFHQMTALRLFLSCCINGVAVLAFIVAGAVAWPEASLMLVGAVLGGYGGARVVRRLKPELLRRLVIAMGLAMSAYFFVRRFG